MCYLADTYHKLPVSVRSRIRKVFGARQKLDALRFRHIYPRLTRIQSWFVNRERRDRCWCDGDLEKFDWHQGFGVCLRCGTYVNKFPPTPASLEKFYSLGSYWRRRQKLKGLPTIDHRSDLYRSEGRVDQWLNLLDTYAPARGHVVEIGCAPGVLLTELSRRGYRCTGVEISDDVAQWLRETQGLNVVTGFFPGVSFPRCDIFLAFDVLEHSPCPLDFLKAAAANLSVGGIAIIQTPIDRYSYVPPFGERFDLFDDLEHLFLFTNRAMEMLGKAAGFELISVNEGCWVGGEVCVFRKAGY